MLSSTLRSRNDIVRGYLTLEIERSTSSTSSSRGGDDGNRDRKAIATDFYNRFEGVTITVTGVEYVFSEEEQQLVVTDTYKLGRCVDFHEQQDQQQRITSTQQQQEEQKTSTMRIEYPFEIELPQANPEVEIDMNDFQPFAGGGQDVGNDHDDVHVPDAQSLSSSSLSLSYRAPIENDDNEEGEDDRDDDREWEMLSTKRHSLSRPTMVRKQYAYKVKAVLNAREH
jgi:hypothetical protein